MALPGRWALTEDEGFRVVFRRADRGRAFAVYTVGSVVVVAGTIALLLREPFSAGAIVAAVVVDAVLISVLRMGRRIFAPGPFIVDGSEKRFFFPGGADLEFRALQGIRVRRAGQFAELSLVLDVEELRLGPRPLAEVERAAAAVARLTGAPVEDAAQAPAGRDEGSP